MSIVKQKNFSALRPKQVAESPLGDINIGVEVKGENPVQETQEQEFQKVLFIMDIPLPKDSEIPNRSTSIKSRTQIENQSQVRNGQEGVDNLSFGNKKEDSRQTRLQESLGISQFYDHTTDLVLSPSVKQYSFDANRYVREKSINLSNDKRTNSNLNNTNDVVGESYKMDLSFPKQGGLQEPLAKDFDNLSNSNSQDTQYGGRRQTVMPIQLPTEIKEMKQVIFGEDSSEQEDRIRKNSPFGHFQSWRLVHMIVQTGDNLKQEQFALQLIDQFNQIFQMEKLDLILRPYEVLSLGPQEGIIEMVKNSTTIDGLQKNLNQHFKHITSISDFFVFYYGDRIDRALQKFISSLAAYSLVCYFLQVKDRHNGNILLHEDGSIIHIDFGFFLSIAPGQGIQLEGKVPFQLINQHLELLGGVDSPNFNLFRKLFFKGFEAAVKHQEKILILVKMLYSGQGATLPCFEKGEQAIVDLQQRFNPQASNDGDLYIHTNDIINKSLQNWRTRWYDKYQYWCQGIFY